MSDNLKVFDRVYVNVVGFKVKDENGNTLTFTRGTPSQLGIIVPEQNVTASQAYTQIQFNKEIVVGEEYVVTINGTVKTITAQTISGSLLLAWGNNIYIEYANSSMYFDVLDSSQYGTYTVKVEESSGGTNLITKSITANGTYNASDDSADGYSSVTVNVSTTTPTLQSKTATPSETAQTITADSGYDGLSSVSVAAISSTYIGSGITQRTSTDLVVSGATVTVPSGHYASQATKTVASGTPGTPTATKGTVSNHSISITPTVTNTTGYITGGTINGTAVTVNASELASGTKTITANGTGIDVVGYATVDVDVPTPSYTATITNTGSSSATYVTYNNVTYYTKDDTFTFKAGESVYLHADGRASSSTITIDGVTVASGFPVSYTYTLPDHNIDIYLLYSSYGSVAITESSSVNLQSKTGISPTESSQTIAADSGYDGLSSVQIDAISSTYVGSGIAQRDETDLTASGATVTVPSGYYANQATKSVASGTEGTPTASKGTVSHNSISITPSVTNSEGYISGGTRTGNSVTVTARELVQGVTLYMDDGAGNYDVANAETFVVDEGTAGTPTASKSTVSNHSISVTPTVTNVSGYIDGGTKTGTAVSVSASELVSGTYSVTSSGTKDVTNYASISVGSGTEGTPTATKGTVNNHSVSITPSVTNSGGYITGSTKTGTAVTVSASELVSGSQTITENGTVNVTNLASVNVAIPVVTYYTGTSEPVASQYNDGDIYLKVVSN